MSIAILSGSAASSRYPVFEAHLTNNWRAFRTWGVSAISPWEHGHFWRLRDGLKVVLLPCQMDVTARAESDPAANCLPWAWTSSNVTVSRTRRP
jgi:hypothetical protein